MDLKVEPGFGAVRVGRGFDYQITVTTINLPVPVTVTISCQLPDGSGLNKDLRPSSITFKSNGDDFASLRVGAPLDTAVRGLYDFILVAEAYVGGRKIRKEFPLKLNVLEPPAVLVSPATPADAQKQIPPGGDATFNLTLNRTNFPSLTPPFPGDVKLAVIALFDGDPSPGKRVTVTFDPQPGLTNTATLKVRTDRSIELGEYPPLRIKSDTPGLEVGAGIDGNGNVVPLDLKLVIKNETTVAIDSPKPGADEEFLECEDVPVRWTTKAVGSQVAFHQVKLTVDGFTAKDDDRLIEIAKGTTTTFRMPKNVFTTGTPGPNATIVIVALDADKKPLGNESTVAFTVLHTVSPLDGFAVNPNRVDPGELLTLKTKTTESVFIPGKTTVRFEPGTGMPVAGVMITTTKGMRGKSLTCRAPQNPGTYQVKVTVEKCDSNSKLEGAQFLTVLPPTPQPPTLPSPGGPTITSFTP